MTNEFDAVIIGSGINSLVAGAMLSKRGWRVAVLERNDRAGGAIATRTDLFPGYTVELLSSWHPLFVGGPAYAELASDLTRLGVEYLNTEDPTGVICAAGSAILSTDISRNTAQFGALGDLAAWNAVMSDFGGRADLAFGLLGTDFWRASAAKFGWKAWRKLGKRGLLASGAELLEPAAPWVDRTFESPVTKALLAPWALHNGLGPDDAASAFITKVIAAAISMGGMPIPLGGGVKLVEALCTLIAEAGGELVTNAEAVRIEVTGGKARSVRTASGVVYHARKAILASVTPQALYLHLLDRINVPSQFSAAASSFRYGRAGMQIHLAMSEPPKWTTPGMGKVALVHVLDSMDSLSESVNAANRGFLPRRPTIVVGQPAAIDPSRAPVGAGLLWIQLQEVPREIRGDLAGEIDHTGGWTTDVRDRYADRVIEQLKQHISNIDSHVIGTKVLGPADLAELDVNLVGGDPYAGDCRVDQYALWRPLNLANGHKTGVGSLWHIGASTHPGPGLGGGSGYLVAKRLLD
jgi:phytoene dehydrogenase-like protein